jgi:hypothetical protein
MKEKTLVAILLGAVGVLVGVWLVLPTDTGIDAHTVARSDERLPIGPEQALYPDTPHSDRLVVEAENANPTSHTLQTDSLPEGKRVRGKCVTTSGSVIQNGHMYWTSAIGRLGRPINALIVNGEFDVLLPPHIGDGGHAVVNVENGVSMLFVGMVRLGDYIILEVRSPNDPGLTPQGQVSVNGPWPEKWKVEACIPGYNGTVAFELGDPHQTQSSRVALTLIDARLTGQPGGAILQLVGGVSKRNPGSVISHRAYSSWELLVSQLAVGVSFDTYYHRLVLGDHISKTSRVIIAPLDFGRRKFRDVEIVSGEGRVLIGDSGRFSVVAKTNEGHRIRGEVEIAASQIGDKSIVRWMAESGGKESSEVIVLGPDGSPINNAICWWRLESLPGGRGYEVWGEASDTRAGVVTIEGLHPGVYVLHTQSLDGDSFAETVHRVPSEVPITVTHGARLGRVALNLKQANPYADVIPQSVVWLRNDSLGDVWRRRDLEPPKYLPIIRALEAGDYSVAVRAGDLVGSASTLVDGVSDPVDVTLELTFPIEGSIRFPANTNEESKVVAVIGGTMPWEISPVDKDGRFRLWSPTESPELTVQIRSSRSFLHRWNYDSGNPDTVVVSGN